MSQAAPLCCTRCRRMVSGEFFKLQLVGAEYLCTRCLVRPRPSAPRSRPRLRDMLRQKTPAQWLWWSAQVLVAMLVGIGAGVAMFLLLLQVATAIIDAWDLIPTYSGWSPIGAIMVLVISVAVWGGALAVIGPLSAAVGLGVAVLVWHGLQRLQKQAPEGSPPGA